jgi:hypothetical protein
MTELLPFSRGELRGGGMAKDDLFRVLWTGSYPAIFRNNLPPNEWLASYVATYVERDVRQLLNVTDLLAFQTFLRLCAGRTGQLLNLSALGSDAGITHNTARSWLSVLEASYICFRLPPYYRKLSKRLVKTPKLHFYDSGLACYLLGIRSPDELRHHPLRGAIFESWVLSEMVKPICTRARCPISLSSAIATGWKQTPSCGQGRARSSSKSSRARRSRKTPLLVSTRSEARLREAKQPWRWKN